MIFKAIAHNALAVTDMVKALEFYCGKIGLKKAFALDAPQGKPWIVYLKIAKGAFLELFYNGVKDREKAYDFDAIGYSHWAVSVDDIAPLAERLWRNGVFESEAAKKTAIEKENIWIHDPGGNAVEFCVSKVTDPALAEATDDGIVFTGLGHVAFVVRDMEKSMEFYRDILGFEFFNQIDREFKACKMDGSGNPWMNFLRVNPVTTIELSYGVNEPFKTGPNSAGFKHMCLECDDVFQTVEYLHGKGVQIDSEAEQGVDGNCQAWIHDPDGNKIELMAIGESSPQNKA
ncbi:MAG: VOC family protein [Clostridiales bacterium]|jgi:catechol 2,3-dioxygenase-like lactoylglutathione lyase family enzyme|nr:VOC family protein [Clostridiales bacterium]